MPDIFQILTEAKIREWQNRPDNANSASPPAQFQQNSSFEKQLLDEILTLTTSAKSADEDTSERNLATAKNLELQLMVILEKQGLNLTARRIAEEINELRSPLGQNAQKDVGPK